MTDLGARIAQALRQAKALGQAVRHVTLCAADMANPSPGLPPVKLVPGLDASRSVLWATSPGSNKLTPHEL